jgi:hypothetical protein
MEIDKISKVFNLLLATSDGVTIGLGITLSNIAKVTTCKSMILNMFFL